MTTPISTPPAWRDQIGELRYLAAKVGRVHGTTHPDMAILSEVVATLADSPAKDHVAHLALAQRIKELTHDFQPWSGACASVRSLYQGLSIVSLSVVTAPVQS